MRNNNTVLIQFEMRISKNKRFGELLLCSILTNSFSILPKDSLEKKEEKRVNYIV
jgi:hypothetical protein